MTDSEEILPILIPVIGYRTIIIKVPSHSSSQHDFDGRYELALSILIIAVTNAMGTMMDSMKTCPPTRSHIERVVFFSKLVDGDADSPTRSSSLDSNAFECFDAKTRS